MGRHGRAWSPMNSDSRMGMMRSTPAFRFVTRSLALILLAAITVGCSLHKARKSYDEGRYEEAALSYREVLAKDPSNVKARIGYRAAATRAAEACVERAKTHKAQKQDSQANFEARRALSYDPGNAIAMDMLVELERAAEALKADQDIEALKEEAESHDPLALDPRSATGINFNFSKKTSLKDILATLSQGFGVSMLFHSSYQDTTIQADLRGLSFQRMLDTLMLQSDLFYRVLGPNTIMIFKSTQPNRQQYDAKLTKTFFLSNADPNDVRNVFQTLIGDAKLFIDKRMNAVVVTAKPNEIAVATRIVNTLDKPKAEVMVYLELLEVTENTMEQVGLLPITSPDMGIGGGSGIFRLGATIDNTGGLNQNKGGIRITRSDVRFLFPSLALDALKNSGDAKLVASPNVRVASGEPGEVTIGQKVSTTNSQLGMGMPTGMTGANTGNLGNLGMNGMMPQTSFNYEDIGVKIKVEPRVHQDRNITLKIDASITTQIAGSTPGRPDIGQRVVKTTTRLKDGETAVFGGLLKEDEQKSLQGIWGLTDVPILGKLLGNSFRKRAKTDVILTVRTVLVRSQELTAKDFEVFDPERYGMETGPFAPKPAKAKAKVEAPKTEVPKADAAKPAVIKTETPVPPPAKVEAAHDVTQAPPPVQPVKLPGGQEALPAGDPKVTAEEKPAATRPDDQKLVVFISPLNSNARKGERIQLAVLVSGGKGITGGQFEMRLDPRLKLNGVMPADYLTNDGGSSELAPVKDGKATITFKRATAQGDSGTLAILDLEVVGAPGNAPVLIQGAKFLVGSNPIPAQVLGALVVVE